MQRLQVVTALFAAIVLATLFVLAGYSSALSDDYCIAEAIQAKGFLPSQQLWFMEWTGRYTSTLLVSLIGVLPLAWYPVFGLTVLAFTVIGAVRLTHALGGGAVSRWRAVQFGVIAVLVYSINLPSVLEAYYWASGALTYQLANAVGMLLFAFLLSSAHESIRTTGADVVPSQLSVGCAAGAAVFVVGCNEILMMLGDMLLAVYFYWLWRTNPMMFRRLLPVMAAAVIGTLVVLLAPGNQVRLQHFTGNRDMLQAFGQSSTQALRLGATLLSTPTLWLLAWISLESIDRIVPPRLKQALEIRPNLPWLALFALLVVIAACLFPSYWSTGQAPPPRARALPLLLFCVAWPFLFWLFARKVLQELQLKPGARQLACFVLMASVVWSAPAQQWMRDIGSASRYANDHRMQREMIREAVSRNQLDVVLPEAVNLPKTLTSSEFMLNGDKSNFVNYCFVRYHRLRSIEFKKAGDMSPLGGAKAR